MNNRSKHIFLLSLVSSFLSVNICQAAIIETGSCASTGSCTTLDAFVLTALNIVPLIYGLAGSLALLYFIYGGIMWLISSGSPDRVKKGTDIIKNAVIGLVIIFASWMIINFVVTSLGYNISNFGGSWSTKFWSN